MQINELTFGLCESDYDASSIDLIQNFLARKIHNEVDTRQALQLISWVKESESLPLNALSEKTGVHYKKLERIFSRYTGYNPKNFTRVIRFYKSAPANEDQVILTYGHRAKWWILRSTTFYSGLQSFHGKVAFPIFN